MSPLSAFKTADGEARFLATYAAVLKLWPLPCTEIDIPGRFGTTHAIVTGPQNAPPLVLLHGYAATSMMWTANVADFARQYRVYAIDTMGQPGKSSPGEPIRNAADYVAWLTETLDALRLDRILLIGQSFGGWLAINYAAAVPTRVEKLVLLSAGGILPVARQFSLRGMLMMFLPTRLTVNSFMHWAGLTDQRAQPVLDLMYLGMKYFRMPAETLRILATPLSDDELRRLPMPVLLLFGDQEVLCDPRAALARARRLIPDFEGGLIPGCSHDMSFTQSQMVDVRVLGFLPTPRAPRLSTLPSVA
jgi:pimeloyl-ACP methyl ester carboxylesterase